MAIFNRATDGSSEYQNAANWLCRWLRLSLPHRVGAATGLPVTHVVGSQTRLVDRADERRHGGRRSVYLDGQGAARVLGVDEAAAPARGTGQ